MSGRLTLFLEDGLLFGLLFLGDCVILFDVLFVSICYGQVFRLGFVRV